MWYAVTRFTGILAVALFASSAVAQSAQVPATEDLASMHAKRVGLACSACHGQAGPTALSAEQSLAATNQSCEGCHGGYAKLAEITAPKLANKYINPHASHLVAIDCTTCHGGHLAAESFCLQCHAFDMPMPGAARTAKR